MDNIIYISSPFFEKHLKYLTKHKYNNTGIITDTNINHIDILSEKTNQCNILKKCNILLTHSDGSKMTKNKKLGSQVKKKTKKWRGSNKKDLTSIPSLVRRTLYETSNIIGNKGVLAKILGDRNYLPKTLNIKDSINLDSDLKRIWNQNKFGIKNPVILKPSIGQEQRGIGVCISYIEAHKHIKKVLKLYPKYTDWEVQQYIYKPLSIQGDILFPALKNGTKIPLKESGGEERNLSSRGFYKCHLRAFGLIVYLKKTNKYKLCIYNRYKFNSAREPYPTKLLNDNLKNIDFSNPWPHKSGGTEGGAIPFDFNDLISHLEKNGLTEKIIPKITTKDLNNNIKNQIDNIMLEVLETAIKKGNCCKPTSNSIDTALCIYHPMGVDLLIDHNKKVWFIEANPGVGFSLIPSNVVSIYKDNSNILKKINGMNKFNARLYNLLRIVSKNERTENIKGYGGFSQHYFKLYIDLMSLHEKYQNIDSLRKLTDKEINFLKGKLEKINGFKVEYDFEKIKKTKIQFNYKNNLGSDYVEYIRNYRFFWRHRFIDNILNQTLDKLIGKNSYNIYFKNCKFEILKTI